jgi:hypothetical protein
MQHRPHPELTNPHEFPIMFAHVWDCYLALSRTRQNGMAANPFTFQEIESYQRVAHNELTTYEIELLKRLDIQALNSAPKPKKG